MTSSDAPLYTKAFLRHYGEQLTREEIRLVQGYRGLSETQREGLLQLVSGLVIERARAASEARAKKVRR